MRKAEKVVMRLEADLEIFEREVGVHEPALVQLQHAEGHALKNLKMISV